MYLININDNEGPEYSAPLNLLRDCLEHLTMVAKF